MLALDGQVEIFFLRNEGRVIVMLGVFKVDQGSLLESDDPDPVELGMPPGVVIFFCTGIDALPAADTPGEIEPVAPQGGRDGALGG